MEVELGQWKQLVIQRISFSLMGRVDRRRTVLSGPAADARECVHRFRLQLSPPPLGAFSPTSTTVPPAEVCSTVSSLQALFNFIYLFTYLLVCVPEDSRCSLRCSRALLFKEGLRHFREDACAVPYWEHLSWSAGDWSWSRDRFKGLVSDQKAFLLGLVSDFVDSGFFDSDSCQHCNDRATSKSSSCCLANLCL